MFNTLSTLVLLPILLPQGLWVRWTTPKLPEAAGDREGIAGQGQPIRLLIIGDSAAAGVGVAHQKDSLSGNLVTLLSQRFEVHWQLHATTGHKTQDVIERIEALPEQDFDVVVTSVGVNDVTSNLMPDEWISQQERMFSLLKERFSVQKVCVTPVPPMHLFPALPQPLRWCLGQRAAMLNEQLDQLLMRLDHCHSVDAISEIASESNSDTRQATSNFRPEGFSQQQISQFMASDGFHPGEALYRLWGEAVSRKIINQL